MTPHEYKRLRARLGSQRMVAGRLGVTVRTIQRRESGATPINHEAAAALRVLSKNGGERK